MTADQRLSNGMRHALKLIPRLTAAHIKPSESHSIPYIAFHTRDGSKARTPDSSVNRFDTLSDELLLHILSFLHSPIDQNADRTDLKHANLTCRTLSRVIPTLLFRSVTIKLHFDTSRPIDGFRWAKPWLLELAEQHPHLAATIKRVRLEVYPFPLKSSWSAEECELQLSYIQDYIDPGVLRDVARLTNEAHKDTRSWWRSLISPFSAKGGVLPRSRSFSHTTANLGTPDMNRTRQRHISEAFSEFWRGPLLAVKRCPTHLRFPKRGQETLERLLQLLPHMEHLEPGAWSPDYIEGSRTPCRLEHLERHSIVYATSLVLRAMSARVKSAGLYALCPRFYSIMKSTSDDDASASMTDPTRFILMGNRSSPKLHLHLPKLLLHLRTLSIDIGFLTSSLEQIMLPTKHSLAYWRDVLGQLHHLRSFQLVGPAEFGRLSNSHCLQRFFQGLLMPSVLNLELSRWEMTTSLLGEGFIKTFPNIQFLRLDRPHQGWQGDLSRPEVLQELKSNHSIPFDVELKL